MVANGTKEIGIALVGCGIVGGGTAHLLLTDRERMEQTTGCTLVLRHVVDKNHDHARSLGVPEGLLHSDLDKALADPAVSVVIELVGGTGFAKDLFLKAFKAGKHVVTANKALLAAHGRELFAEARKAGVALAFEASCGGGIPVVRALYDGLLANEITAVYGIVNGTCNFILTEMSQKSSTYEAALKGAQAAGFAEADPTLDVEGIDASHKISILGSLAFGSWIDVKKVEAKGISTVSASDVTTGQRLGYVLKLIAQAEKGPAGIFARVEPAFIPASHPLAWVNGSFNAVSVYGKAVGHTLYYGRGAGASPTASAVVADVLSLASGSYQVAFDTLKIWLDKSPQAEVLDAKGMERRFYVRMNVQDKPGNLADITRIVGKNQISVASIHQDEGADSSGMVPVVMILHSCPEHLVKSALAEIAQLGSIDPAITLIPILDERKEFA